MQSMHDASSAPPAARPQISCGVGRCCDAETAVAGMLRRVVRTYEGALPRRRVCGVLRGFLALLQRFASSNAAGGPQEQYPPSVHIVSGSDSGSGGSVGSGGSGGASVSVTVEPQIGYASLMALGECTPEMRELVAAASASIGCVVGTLVSTAMAIQAALERPVCSPCTRGATEQLVVLGIVWGSTRFMHIVVSTLTLCCVLHCCVMLPSGSPSCPWQCVS